MSKVSLREQAYKHLQQKILSGELAAGSVVSELSLAKEIGIGRTPVREAVRQLQIEGLVEQVPRYGTIVCKPSRQDLIELFQIREALEPYAVGLAVELISTEEIAVLERLCDKAHSIAEELEQSGADRLEGSLLQLFLAADMTFHMLLFRAAGNERLEKLIGDTRVFNRIFSARRHLHDLPIVKTTHHHHRQIVEAIKKKDADEAKKWTLTHIRKSFEQALENFDRSQSQPPIPLPANVEIPEEVLKQLGLDESDNGVA